MLKGENFRADKRKKIKGCFKFLLKVEISKGFFKSVIVMDR